MDRISYSKKQTIYDIYRACRLCGGGAGYKMPIVQSVIDLDTNGLELKQKIQECLQIEVHQDDKMPPLICELCVDKVNDFYEFMEMCRQTNKRTRLRLGLPLQTVKKSTSDSGDCILGVTEPIHDPEDDNEPLSKQVRGGRKKEIKKEKVDEPLSKSLKKQNEPLSKSVKKKDDEPLSKSLKKKDVEPLSKSMRKKDDEPLSKSMRKKDEKKDDEPLSKSVKKKDDEPLSKSAKKKEDEPLSKSVKKKDDEPLSKSVKKKDIGKKNAKDVKVKKESDIKVKLEKGAESPVVVRKTRGARAASPERPRSSRASHSEDTSTNSSVKLEKGVESPVVVRKTRGARAASSERPRSSRVSHSEDNSINSSVKNANKPPKSSPQPNSSPPGKGSLRRELQQLLDDTVLYMEEEPRSKRAREKDLVVEKRAEKAEVPAKKLKLSASPRPPPAPPRPRAARAASPPPPPPPPQHPCPVCGLNNKTGQGLGNHIKTHVVTFTQEKWACNPCGEWFSSNEETSTHHKKHKTKPYRCRHCYSVFKLLSDYNEHFAKEDCKPYIEIPDKKCAECWRTYPTQLLLDQHRCQGPDGRPGGKCMKCNRMYTLLKNLKKHEATCTFRKKGEAIVDPEVEKRLRDAQIHMIRCDDLLKNVKGDSYDVSDVDSDFGFDYKYVYPYRYRVKPEPNTGYDNMVAIGDEVKDYYSRNYVHWDSDDTDTDVDEKKRKIDSLTAITLKTIFSNKLLGKVPRRRRIVKAEKAFDDIDFDMSKDINTIIGNLSQDVKNKTDSANDSDCSESIFGPFKPNDTISENAFDTLLGGNDSQDTEKNFDLFNSSGENKDSSDLGKVNDSQNNDNEDNDSQAVSNSIDSGVKNYEDCPVGKDNNFESKEYDNTSTDSNVNDNDDNISQKTEFSESLNEIDETNTESQVHDTSQSNVKESDSNDNLEIGPKEQISLSIKDTENNVNLDNIGKVDDTIKSNHDSTNLDTPKETNEEANVKVNGNNLVNDSSDVEMDDKKLMDALDEQIGENTSNGDENINENRVVHDTVSKGTDGSDFNIVNSASDPKTGDFNENNGELVDNSAVVGNNDLISEQNDKILSDVVSKGRNNLSGMDLDNISDDEFSFDA